MKFLVISLFFSSICYGQTFELIYPATYKVTKLKIGDIPDLERINSIDYIIEFSKRIDENPEFWQADKHSVSRKDEGSFYVYISNFISIVCFDINVHKID